MFSLAYKSRLPLFVFLSLIVVESPAALPAAAQGPPGMNMPRPQYMSLSTYRIRTTGNLWVVAGRVLTMGGEVIQGARVQVNPLGPEEFRIFTTDPAGEFETTYSPTAERFTDFKVQLTVTKKGFQTAHQLVDLGEFKKPVRLPITLLPEEEDSRLLSRQDLISHLLAQLQTLGPGSGISAKSQKAYAKGVEEFVTRGRPDRSLRYFSEVVKRDAACAKCRTMLALAELDSGNWDGAARDANSALDLTLKDPRTGSPEAMLLAGVMESWMHQPQGATNFLVSANKIDPKDSLVLQEIGRAQLELQQYEIAGAYLSRALAAGAAPEARLLLAKALMGEDNVARANQEMDRYLNGREAKTMPLWGRQIWAEIQSRKKIDALYAGTGKAKSKMRGVAIVDYLHGSGRDIKGLDAAQDQSQLQPVLTAVGKNVASLFQNLQNTTSLEKVRLEKLLRNGKPAESMSEKYRYLCLMPADPRAPAFNEYRKNLDADARKRGSLERGYMLTSGFVSAALIFHPAYQAQSTFRLLGRQMMDGRETYVIAFAQIPQKAELFGMFRLGSKSAPTFQQGLAWVDVKNDRIVRLRTDLLRPLPEVRLTKETTQIDYQDVHFKQGAQGFWLPKDVTVTVGLRGKTLRNVHHYSDFKLFNVGHSEKTEVPEPPKVSATVPADSQGRPR